MRLLMGIIKDRHGTFYARKKVPKNLETAVAKITDAGKPRVSWLKVSLRTKDRKQANTEAKAHLARFDRILAELRQQSLSVRCARRLLHGRWSGWLPIIMR